MTTDKLVPGGDESLLFVIETQASECSDILEGNWTQQFLDFGTLASDGICRQDVALDNLCLGRFEGISFSDVSVMYVSPRIFRQR